MRVNGSFITQCLLYIHCSLVGGGNTLVLARAARLLSKYKSTFPSDQSLGSRDPRQYCAVSVGARVIR